MRDPDEVALPVEAFLQDLRWRLETQRPRLPGPEVDRTIDEAGEHIRDAIDELTGRGFSAREAIEEALRRFGAAQRVADELAELRRRRSPRARFAAIIVKHGAHRRRRRGGGVMDGLLEDFRISLRMLRRRPGFSVATVVVLALGIGATSGVYSVANAMVWRPPPGVESPDELGLATFGVWRPDGGMTVRRVSYPNYRDLQERLQEAVGITAYQTGSLGLGSESTGALQLRTQFVTASFFDVLGVRIPMGRGFSRADDDPAGPARVVTVIGHHLWQQAFGGDRDIVGREVRLNGVPATVVGVAPRQFRGTDRLGPVDLWVPGGAQLWVRHFPDPQRYARRNEGAFYEFVVRRRSESTWEQVQAELDSMGAWLAENYPEANETFLEAGFRIIPDVGSRAFGRNSLQTTFILLLGIVGLVLLIACSNVASLILAQGMRRRPELAIRKALGAGAWRIGRQQLVEASVLWSLGGATGFLLASLVLRFSGGFLPAGAEPILEGVTLDPGVLLLTVAVSLGAGLIFALLPAAAAARTHAREWLVGGRAGAGGRRRLAWGAFNAVQLAASVVLVVGALLFVRTLQQLTEVDLGFEPAGVTVFSVNPGDHGYETAEQHAYVDEIRRRLEERPEIVATAVGSRVPLGCCGWVVNVHSPGADEGTEVEARQVLVTPTYRELLGIPLYRGRDLTATELTAGGGDETRSVLVNRALARRLFGDTEAVGAEIEIGTREPLRLTIVGVVANARFEARDLTEEPQPVVYRPLVPGEVPGGAEFVVKAIDPSVAVEPIVRETAATIDPDLPLSRIAPLSDNVALALGQWRLFAGLLSAFSVIALTMAAVGLYGLVASGVTAKRREIGIRMALGARSRRVLATVLRSAAITYLAGLVLGMAGALALTRLIENRLFGVTRLDPLTWTSALAILLLTCVVATLEPARRAVSVDPVEAIRVNGER